MPSLAEMAREQLEKEKKKKELKKKNEKKIEELHPPKAPELPKKEYEPPEESLEELEIDVKNVDLADVARKIADSNIFQMLITNIVRMVMPEHKFPPGMNRKSKDKMSKDFIKSVNEINKSVKITTDVKEIMRGSKLAYADVMKELKEELEKRRKKIEKGEK